MRMATDEEEGKKEKEEAKKREKRCDDCAHQCTSRGGESD